VKAFARKMVKRKSAPKGCIRTGESVKYKKKIRFRRLEHSSHGLGTNARICC